MRDMWVQSLGQEDPWKKEWQRTPVFLPGESPRIGEPGGHSPWGCRESDGTETIYMPWHFFPCPGRNTQYMLRVLVELDLELIKGDNCL